jgi:hypothetical protein
VHSAQSGLSCCNLCPHAVLTMLLSCAAASARRRASFSPASDASPSWSAGPARATCKRTNTSC